MKTQKYREVHLVLRAESLLSNMWNRWQVNYDPVSGWDQGLKRLGQHVNKVPLCCLFWKPNPCCPFLKRWGNESMRMTVVEKKSPQSQPDPDFQHKEEMRWSQERNSHSPEAAENWVCSVCLCGACVWALIKERRFFKHIRAILSNCFTPSSISTRTKDTDCGTKQCSPALLCAITLSRPGADTNRQDQRN